MLTWNILNLLAQGTTVRAAESNLFLLDAFIVIAGAGLVLFAVCRSSNRR